MEFGHFVVPLADIGAYEVEDPFERWDDVLCDVVFRVEVYLGVV